MLIPTPQNVKTVTDMRERALSLIKDVQRLGVAFLFQRSDPKLVLLSLDEYQRLAELAQEQIEVTEAEKILLDKGVKFLPIERFWKKYKLAS